MCYKSEELRIKNTPATHELKRDSSDKLTQESRNDLVAAGRDKKPSNPGRCFQCNKKIGISGFKCRCEHTFCASHRQYNKHNCTFDFKSHSREALSKANPAVVADKIEKVKFATFAIFSKFSFKIWQELLIALVGAVSQFYLEREE